jgi:nitrogen fixation protein FixH
MTNRKELTMKIILSCCACIAALAVIAAVPAAAREGGGFAKKSIFTKHFNKTLFDITENAAYSVEVLLDDSEYAIGKDHVGIVVHDASDRDVKGADLAISLKDLATGENAAKAVKVQDKNNGLYIVSGLALAKEGRWELAVTVKKGSVSGGVKFILPDALKERVPKGRYSP